MYKQGNGRDLARQVVTSVAAIAQVVAVQQAQLRQLAPGITPPLVIKYSASSIPVIQLGLASQTMPEQGVFDAADALIVP